MSLAVDGRYAERWAKRVQNYEGAEAYQQILDELGASRANALDLLGRLADFSDPVVRAWAGTAAKKLFGSEAIPLLAKLMKDREPDVRDIARDDLIELDPASERTLLPDFRGILKRRKDKWGEDRQAMFRVARLRDRDSVPLLRAYAAASETRYWHNRMPLVLADYIEDPSSVTRRIRAHDHGFMFWLADAALILGISDAQDALKAVLDQPIDDDCAQIARAHLRPRENDGELVTFRSADDDE